MTTRRPVLAAPERAALLAIVVLAAALRLLDLDDNPAGFFCDEASVGYDALALGQTGRDQYGTLLPMFARSFGDYDEASYRYLDILPIALLGPTVAATRLPAALAGIGLVVALYFLARRWWNAEVAIAVGLLAAINPWLVLFSRIAFRGILLPVALTAALLLVERARARGRGVIWAAVAFAAALWTYSPARIVVPFMLAIVLLTHGRALWRDQRREMIGGAAVIALVLAMLGSFWISPEGMARARSELRASYEGVLVDYSSYFSYAFLFRDGDPNLRHSLREWGQMLPFEIITISWGALALARRRWRADATLVAWILIAPVPAALTMPNHALRAIALAPALVLLSGIGVGTAIRALRGVAARRVTATVAVAGFVLFAAVPMWRAVLVDYPRYAAGAWQWGMREGVQALEETGRPCQAVSSRIFLPHIFVLFFGRVPPEEYQRNPVDSITQGDMTYDRYAIGSWRIVPAGAAGRDARECSFLALHDERAQIERAPGARVVTELFGPQGEHWFDVFVFED